MNTLQLALANGYQSIAFPAISTGVYGYPRAAAAEIAVNTVLRFTTAGRYLSRFTSCVLMTKRPNFITDYSPSKAMITQPDMTRLERAITRFAPAILNNAASLRWMTVWMRLPLAIDSLKWQNAPRMCSITSGRTTCPGCYCFRCCWPQRNVACGSVCCWTTTTRRVWMIRCSTG